MIEVIPFGYIVDIALVIAVMWVFGKPLLIYCWKWWRNVVKEQRERLNDEHN